MNGALFARTLAWQRTRLVVVVLAAFGWGILIPIFYTGFSDVVRDLANSGAIPEELLSFGSGSLFSLPGAVTLGLQHPFAIALLGIFAAGATATAVAGERQRGTLEVLLARPLSRRTVYVSIGLALLLAVAIVLAALLGGFVTGAATQGILEDLAVEHLPMVFLNGFLLWGAFATFGLAASVSFDRTGPAMGLTLAYLLVNYFFEILGSLWADAEWTQEYSLFHHWQPAEILKGSLDPIDLVIVGVAFVLPILYALVVFPRRDLAAAS
ncbi:MAG TPA: ABC transporter permease subunit [Candidatus Limnocylindria bacterium]|nr:ABC transporter permease subunit [Candidatus Limnocylindria bacterium]